MQKVLFFIFLSLVCLPAGYAQLQAEFQPMYGNPFMLSGKNNSSYGAVTGRLQISYQRERAPWHPYIAASITGMALPLHSKDIDDLSVTVRNTAFKAGLNGTLYANEERRPTYWILGGGIGVCMFRPDEDRLRRNGEASNLLYTELTDKAWFPEAELHTKWVSYLKEGASLYFGAVLLTEFLWLRDNRARYTTNISGKQYNLNFNDFAIWPSIGGVIGWRF